MALPTISTEISHRSSTLLALCALAFLTSACSKLGDGSDPSTTKDDGDHCDCITGAEMYAYSFAGTVRDAATTLPIPGIRICVFSCDYYAAHSDESGAWSITWDDWDSCKIIPLLAEDVDGEDNGSYQGASLQVKTATMGEDTWWDGSDNHHFDYDISGLEFELEPVE